MRNTNIQIGSFLSQKIRNGLILAIAALALAGCQIELIYINLKNAQPTTTLPKEVAVAIVMKQHGIHESWQEDVMALKYEDGMLAGPAINPKQIFERHTFYEGRASGINYLFSTGRATRELSNSLSAYKRKGLYETDVCQYVPYEENRAATRQINAVAARHNIVFKQDGPIDAVYAEHADRDKVLDLDMVDAFMLEAIEEGLIKAKCN